MDDVDAAPAVEATAATTPVPKHSTETNLLMNGPFGSDAGAGTSADDDDAVDLVDVDLHGRGAAHAAEHDADADSDDDDAGREVLVELDNIHKTYLLGIEGVPALRGVSLKVYKGEWIVVYGTSGGGKTTLLNIVGTIDKPTKGELIIGHHRVNPSTPDHVLAQIRLSTLGFVFQAFNLLPSMTATENVILPMTLKGDKSASERKATARALLEQVGLGHRLNHMPNMLSGGEQQRVTIARALANTPPLLLLDEPTGDLDTKNTRNVVRMLRHLNEDLGVTLLMVTHDVYLKNFASRILYMRDGKLLSTEKIPEQTRREAFRELDELDAIAPASGAPPGQSATVFSHTEVRGADAYPMFSIEVPKPAVRKGRARA